MACDKKSGKSEVWQYYVRENQGQCARCSLCKAVLKTVGGSTKGLHTHLQTKHEINLLKHKINDDDQPKVGAVTVSTSQASGRNSTSTGPMKQFILTADKMNNSLPAVLARMTACDGLSFNVFCTSSDLRKALMALGHTLPTSVNTIKKTVMDHGDLVRAVVSSELAAKKKQGDRFSLTFDEWTSTRNRRYMNINIHSQESKFWNVGLVRVHGSMPAERCIALLDEKLSNFDINLHKDIVCLTTDGASVMTKVGKLVSTEQQLCYAHGIQLAVVDVMYKKRTTEGGDKDEQSADDSDEYDEGDNCLEVVNSEYDVVAELSDDYDSVVKKVRGIVKLFRRSPTKNDEILQKHVVSEIGHELNLILDCRTRWSSLMNMLSRFLFLRTSVQKAMIDIKEKPSAALHVTDSDFNIIQEIVSALEPVKLAVEALCRRDANLLSAEATITFCIIQLQKQHSELAKTLAECIESRICERRAVHAGVLQYLHNADATTIDMFSMPPSASIMKFIKRLLVRLDLNDFDSNENPEQGDVSVCW